MKGCGQRGDTEPGPYRELLHVPVDRESPCICGPQGAPGGGGMGNFWRGTFLMEFQLCEEDPTVMGTIVGGLMEQ